MDTVPEDTHVTPYDLVNVSRLSKIDPHVVEIAQFLQSIDDGSTPTVLIINSSFEASLNSVSQQNLSTDRSRVRNNSLTQLTDIAASNAFIDRDTASQRMDAYLNSINLVVI